MLTVPDNVILIHIAETYAQKRRRRVEEVDRRAKLHTQTREV